MYGAAMIERKAALLRLYPTPQQASQMAQIAGACRFVYNLALEQRRDWYRAGRTFTFASQCRELTQLRAAADWLKAVPVHPLQQALCDLARAYRNWWEGRTCPPTPRRKGVNDSFRFPDPVSLAVKRTGKSSRRIKLPKLGWIRLRERNWREMPGEIRNVTISHRAGQWFAAVQWEREIIAPTPSALPAVGIDLGIAAFAALSDGSIIAPANHGKKALRALRRAQRSLSRKKRGSRNRRKAIRRVARLHQRVANARKDFLHKTSTPRRGCCGGIAGAQYVGIGERHGAGTGPKCASQSRTEPRHPRSRLARLSGLCSPTSWQTGAHDYSKWRPLIPARPVRRAAL